MINDTKTTIIRQPTPTPDQPGRLGEQLAAAEHFLGDPWRRIDAAGAWMRARELAIPHAAGRDRR